MIEFFSDRKGTIPTEKLPSLSINDTDAIRVDGELVWSRPVDQVRVHPEKLPPLKFNIELELCGTPYDLYTWPGPDGRLYGSVYPATYEEA